MHTYELKETPMAEDRTAIRLHLIRRETERAIRDGRKLDPHLIRAMCQGAKA